MLNEHDADVCLEQHMISRHDTSSVDQESRCFLSHFTFPDDVGRVDQEEHQQAGYKMTWKERGRK